MSTRGLFYVGYALVVTLLVTFWASHVLHHTVAPTLHRVCAVYTCTQSDTDTTGGNR